MHTTPTTQSHYNQSHCWQYEVRKQNLADDLQQAGITCHEMSSLRVSHFQFSHLPKEDKKMCEKIKEFVIRHEWLGNMPHRPTHRFIATYRGQLAGVIVMATPNAFSHLLGKENRNKEKLISRGACISWSPKNLASSLMMFSIRWMVKNTPYRYFSAYSDTEARELGTIYQACNFIYLGQGSGTRFKYYDPGQPHRDWFSDRNFRKISYYKRYAFERDIDWQSDWSSGDKIYWDKVPKAIISQLKEASKSHQASCHRLRVPRKHKYVYIQGKTKKETQGLLNLFYENNPDKQHLIYPKIREPKVDEIEEMKEPVNLIKQVEIKKEEPKEYLHGRSPSDRVLVQELTKRPTPCWPSNKEGAIVSKETLPQIKKIQRKFYSIKEVSQMYGIGQWLIYHHIKTDPTFPYVNVGVKKKLLIDLQRFEQWLEVRSQKNNNERHYLPSINELMETGA